MEETAAAIYAYSVGRHGISASPSMSSAILVGVNASGFPERRDFKAFIHPLEMESVLEL